MPTEKDAGSKAFAIGLIIAAGFVVILVRLWQLQVLQGDELRKLSEANRLRVVGVPAPRGIIYDRNGVPLVKNKPYFCVSVIPAEFQQGAVENLSRLLKVSPAEITRKLGAKGRSPLIPVKLKEGLTMDDVAYIEARKSDFPGLMIEIDVTREYLFGNVGAHLIGYLGKLTQSQAQNPEFRDVPPDAFIGQWGVERLYDKSLRGTPGQRLIEVDALGREIRLLRENLPFKGDDLVLGMDIAMQKEAEKAFEGRPGAMVALRTDTGEVLSYVSSPSFDPNKFASGIDYGEWTSLSRDKALPMLNRAIQSQYPPGSTFKIVTAIAGLEEGVIDDSTVVNCSGGISFGKWSFGCWKKGGHGSVSLHRALVESCDVYFYEVGKRLGIDRIYKYAVALGLGTETGITIGKERKGLIPDTKWKAENRKAPWYLGETYVNAIGQGYVAATPVQLAVMMASVANGGNVLRPNILKNEVPFTAGRAGVSEKTLEKVRAALVGVVNEGGGTAQASRSSSVLYGGKTGTAQVVGIRKDSKYLTENLRDHAWFVAFAPAEKPEVAMSVLVEHGGHGGSASAPIAKKAIEAYMLPPEKKKGLADARD